MGITQLNKLFSVRIFTFQNKDSDNIREGLQRGICPMHASNLRENVSLKHQGTELLVYLILENIQIFRADYILRQIIPVVHYSVCKKVLVLTFLCYKFC